MPFVPITEQALHDGLAAGGERLRNAVIARRVRYDAATNSIIIDLEGCGLIIPRDTVSEFADLPIDAMVGIRLSAVGDALAISGHDVQVDLIGLLADVIPGAVLRNAFARQGGRATSPAKAQAARDNGAKGGRPRRTPVVLVETRR